MPRQRNHNSCRPDCGPRALFHDHGLRCTRQREVIYEALASSKAHPTADELLALVRPREPGISLATVYNTLEAFTEVGLVRRLPSKIGNGPCRFDADIEPHVHVTTSDGRVVDLPRELSDRLTRLVPEAVLAEMSEKLGLEIDGVTIELSARAGEPG